MKLSGENSPHVTWDEMFGATSYEVQVIPLLANAAGKTILRTTVASWDVPEEYRDSAFRVWVRGIGKHGNLGAWNAAPFDVTTGNVPVIHGTPAITVLSAPTVKWANPPGTTATEVWVGDRELNKRVAWTVLSGSRTSFNIPPLEPSRYVVWVRTSGSYGTSDWSTAFDFTILTPAPIVSVVSDVQRHLSVTWTSIPEIQGYELVVRRAGATLPFLRISLPVGTHSYQFAAPVPGDQYTVWVRGTRNGRGYTAWNVGTSLLIRQTPTPRLSLPTISWNVIAQATAYEVVIRDRMKDIEVFRSTTASPTVNVGAAVGPGFYELTVRSLYADGQASQTNVVQFEVSRPVVHVSLVPLPTVDATPVIQWIPADGAASYEIFVSRNWDSAVVYRIAGLTEPQHRVSTPLPPGEYHLWIRAHYPDSTRSIWGPGVPLTIGSAPKVTVEGRTLQWNSIHDATRYDVLVQFETGPGKYSDVVRTQFYFASTFDLSTWTVSSRTFVGCNTPVSPPELIHQRYLSINLKRSGPLPAGLQIEAFLH